MAKFGVNRSVGERLLRLKELLEDERAKQAELKGELKSLMTQLKTEFNLNSLEDAEAKLNELEQVINEHEEVIGAKVKELEEAFGGE
ncbi:MAG TPA: hypothetical protein PKI14_16995 [Fervidobacterium sp.]|nr:hypothetical protein [Candidatus Hydrothermia bacterium]HQE50298.1 hypothetical protein [Fervidobacterium sp.]HUM44643.1 hypothetical protein [Fervidobacterium sp.]